MGERGAAGAGAGQRGLPNAPIMLMTLEEGCKTKRLKWHSPGRRCSTNLAKRGRKYGKSSKEKLQSRSREKTSARSRREEEQEGQEAEVR